VLLRQKSFKEKIIFPTVIVLVALVVVINVFLSARFSELRDSLINERLIAITNGLKHYLESSEENTKAAAISMAINPNAVKAIRERDKDAIISIFTPTHDLYRINYYLICDKEGVVLARTQGSEIYSYSLLQQQSVRDALDNKVSTFFESGVSIKASAQTGAPIYDTDGSLIGAVLAGVRFDTESAVEELKDILQSEVTVYLGNTKIASTIFENVDSTAGITIDPDVAKIVIENKREYYTDMDILGNKYKAFYLPLLNSKKEVFATFFLGIPVEELTAASNRSIRNGIILGLSGLAASVVLLSFIISSISNPIIKLSHDMDHFANGNLNVEISVTSDDEVGHLSKSLKKVVNILHRLLLEINVMIHEQDKGNTDYRLNTEDFQGGFKLLANNILDLAHLGMKDQLTGIPNRRSFDNRLDLEWGRAIREKKPLSILMLDVDKFKNYNDSYGHQQGDVALQTLANVLKQSIKRSIDFAARWGGEEFVIMLPTTDAKGAVCVAEKVRKEIENTPIPSADPRAARVTVSIGVSTQIPTRESSIDNLMAIADSALYKAKETGRNKVVWGGDGSGEEQEDSVKSWL